MGGVDLGTGLLSCFVVRGYMGLPFLGKGRERGFFAEVVVAKGVRCEFGE